MNLPLAHRSSSSFSPKCWVCMVRVLSVLCLCSLLLAVFFLGLLFRFFLHIASLWLAAFFMPLPCGAYLFFAASCLLFPCRSGVLCAGFFLRVFRSAAPAFFPISFSGMGWVDASPSSASLSSPSFPPSFPPSFHFFFLSPRSSGPGRISIYHL